MSMASLSFESVLCSGPADMRQGEGLGCGLKPVRGAHLVHERGDSTVVKGSGERTCAEPNHAGREMDMALREHDKGQYAHDYA
jgi:hypothetical protein